MSTLNPKSISPTDLFLDPNNFRFQDSPDFLYAAEHRFHEDRVQGGAFERLKSTESLLDLKRSIMRNGYLPVEQIVVRPYEHDPGKYIVIEGNRRTAAVKWIFENHAAGVSVAEHVLQTIETLPAIVAEAEGTDEVFRASLMGIRHVSGIKQWGGYQRARLIVEMRDKLRLDAQETAERLALSTHEVNRRYRAFKALQQLQDDEEFGDHATAGMYPILHEAVSLPIVREWLHWNEDRAVFEDENSRPLFYGLITASTDDEGHKVKPKLSGYSHVRELRKILAKPQAKRILLDPHKSLQEAITVAHQDELAQSWTADVNAAVVALEGMGVEQLKNLTENDRKLLERLKDLTGERLKDHVALARNVGNAE